MIPRVPFIQAFDSSGNYLGKTLSPIVWGQPDYGDWKTLLFQSSTRNIAYVQFSSQHVHGDIAIYGMFDNLAYGNEATTTRQFSPKAETFGQPPVNNKMLADELAKLTKKLNRKPT